MCVALKVFQKKESRGTALWQQELLQIATAPHLASGDQKTLRFFRLLSSPGLSQPCYKEVESRAEWEKTFPLSFLLPEFDSTVQFFVFTENIPFFCCALVVSVVPSPKLHSLPTKPMKTSPGAFQSQLHDTAVSRPFPLTSLRKPS